MSFIEQYSKTTEGQFILDCVSHLQVGTDKYSNALFELAKRIASQPEGTTLGVGFEDTPVVLILIKKEGTYYSASYIDADIALGIQIALEPMGQMLYL